MEYREYSPSPALQPFVQCYWAGTPQSRGGDQNGVHRVVPDGCIDILVRFDASTAEGAKPSRPRFADRALVVGTMSRPLIVSEADNTCFLGVRFKPGKAIGFLGVPAGELTDQSIALGDVWTRDGNRLESRLADLRGIGPRLALLEAALLERLDRKRAEDPYLEALVDLILRRQGSVSIAALSKFAGLSRQHVARKFDRYIGINPKLFCRVVRFQSLLEAIRLARGVDWAAAALELGYYDQAHMILEFKEFSGLTPATFSTTE